MKSNLHKTATSLLLVIVTSIFLSIPTSAAPQNSPIISVRVGNETRYYQVIRENGVNQNTAFAQAGARSSNGFRGRLAVLTTVFSEYNNVISTFRSRGIDLRDLWLAANRTGNSPDCRQYWRWSTGVSVSGGYWAPGEPNDARNGDFNCTGTNQIALYIANSSGQFGNISPNATRGNALNMGYVVEFGR